MSPVTTVKSRRATAAKGAALARTMAARAMGAGLRVAWFGMAL